MDAVDDCIPAVITSPNPTSVLRPNAPDTSRLLAHQGRPVGPRDASFWGARPCPVAESSVRRAQAQSRRARPPRAAMRPPPSGLTNAPTKIVGSAQEEGETRTQTSATSQPV